MEKREDTDLQRISISVSKPRRLSPWSRWIVLALAFATTWTLRPDHGTWFPLNKVTTSQDAEAQRFSWDTLETKPHLDYTPCYDDEYQCARLELPMDYWNGSTNATISLAVIKSPAAVPVTHPQYGGAILLNPGGPGGSGVFFLLGAAEFLHEALESPAGKYFDFISFDPRGVGLSKPVIHCFEDPYIAQSWTIRLMEEGVFSASDAAFGRTWSMFEAFWSSCSLPPSNGPDIKEFVSTASVSRDMLEIVERHGEWRAKEAKRLLEYLAPICAKSMKLSKSSLEILEKLQYRRNEEKINYLGFSYGSYLGNTFAAMYPDRINRLAVDGVVDAYDYKKALWFDNLVDTEKAMDLFYYHCARAGYPACALANETGTTTADAVKQRVQNIKESLYHNPLPVISSTRPDVIAYSDVKDFMFAVLYSPIFGFPFMASILRDIERGDGTILAELVSQYHSIDCSAGTGAEGPISEGATIVIACGDGDDQTATTKEEFKEFVEKLSKLSPSGGEMWSSLRLACINYNIRPLSRFEGPWVGNTSHPILEIGNTADPVTPGRYAKKMAEGFEGAGVLMQDSAGHCSLSAPSNCTETYVRQYFQSGHLPPPGTVCEVDALPFGPTAGDSEVLDLEIMNVKKRQAGIARSLYAAGGGFMRRRMVLN